MKLYVSNCTMTPFTGCVMIHMIARTVDGYMDWETTNRVGSQISRFIVYNRNALRWN